MAKTQKVNKTQKVLEYHKAHPGAGNKEIAEALTKQGIKITPAHVANIKGKTKKRRTAARAVVSRRGLGIPEVKAALALLKICGSIPAANAALAAAQEIRALV